MVIHSKTEEINSDRRHEILFMEKVNSEKLKLKFYHLGSDVSKIFGKDEVEATYSIVGKNVSKIYWKLIFRKFTFNNSTTTEEIVSICSKLDLIHTIDVW